MAPSKSHIIFPVSNQTRRTGSTGQGACSSVPDFYFCFSKSLIQNPLSLPSFPLETTNPELLPYLFILIPILIWDYLVQLPIQELGFGLSQLILLSFRIFQWWVVQQNPEQSIPLKQTIFTVPPLFWIPVIVSPTGLLLLLEPQLCYFFILC